MSVFGELSYPAKRYLKIRPSYAEPLYEHLFRYHDTQIRNGKAVDLGCGPGTVTLELGRRFKEVVGVDPSKPMIEVAAQNRSDKGVSWVTQSAEPYIQSLPSESVDLICAGQAVHWFDLKFWFQESSRVLKTGGTLAYWGYGEFKVADKPEITEVLRWLSKDKETLGPFWPQPSRDIVESLYDGIDPPATLFSDSTRIYSPSEAERRYMTSKKMSWPDILNYVRTWSAFNRYSGSHDAEGLLAEATRRVSQTNELAKEDLDNEDFDFFVYWPSVLVLARKLG